MDRAGLASLIDHTLLRPDASKNDVAELCRESIRYGFASSCVNPLWVGLTSELLTGRAPMVCSVVGFPLGASLCAAFEAERAVEDGADELDMVLPAGLLKSGLYTRAEEAVRDVVKASSGRPVKVILETCLLTRDEKVAACEIAIEGGASWVKTSTGFGSGGATAADVMLLRSTVGDRLGVKASGGIRTLENALEMINAGAGRLGCSSSPSIIDSMPT